MGQLLPFLRDPIWTPIGVFIAIIALFVAIATLRVAIITLQLSLPKRSKLPKTPKASKLKVSSTRTTGGCLRDLAIIFVTLYGILYSAIQIFLNPFLLNPWLVIPIFSIFTILCLIATLSASTRLIRGEETPLPPTREQDETENLDKRTQQINQKHNNI